MPKKLLILLILNISIVRAQEKFQEEALIQIHTVRDKCVAVENTEQVRSNYISTRNLFIDHFPIPKQMNFTTCIEEINTTYTPKNKLKLTRGLDVFSQKQYNVEGYESKTNSNNKETLVYVMQLCNFLNKPIDFIGDFIESQENLEVDRFAINIFNVWSGLLRKFFEEKLKYLTYPEHLNAKLVPLRAELKILKKETAPKEDYILQVRRNTPYLLNTYTNYFSMPTKNFTSISSLLNLEKLTENGKQALLAFSLNKHIAEGYDKATNTNNKERLVYIYHLSQSLKKPIGFILNILDQQANGDETDLAIRLYTVFVDLLIEGLRTTFKDSRFTDISAFFIKKANPWMSDYLAKSWAGQYPAPSSFYLKARGRDPESPYTVEGSKLTLYHQPRPGGGLCGYLCLDFSPQESLDKILNNKVKYEEFILSEMKNAGLEGAVPSEMKASVLQYLENYDFDGLENYNRQNIDTFLKGMILGQNMDARLPFVPHFLVDNEAATLIDALAEIQEGNLIICEPTIGFNLKVVHSHLTPNAKKTFYLYFRGGHYDRMFLDPFPINFPEHF